MAHGPFLEGVGGFETRFLCVITLAVLKLVFADQSGLKLTEIYLPVFLPVAGIKSVPDGTWFFCHCSWFVKGIEETPDNINTAE